MGSDSNWFFMLTTNRRYNSRKQLYIFQQQQQLANNADMARCSIFSHHVHHPPLSLLARHCHGISPATSLDINYHMVSVQCPIFSFDKTFLFRNIVDCFGNLLRRAYTFSRQTASYDRLFKA